MLSTMLLKSSMAFPISSIERARDTVSGFMALSSFFFRFLSPEASVSGLGNSLNRDSLHQPDVVTRAQLAKAPQLVFSFHSAFQRSRSRF